MKTTLEKIAGRRVLVAGDVMLDRYWWGRVGRISPEAPVPVVELERTSVAAGGAANVAANLAGLGALPLLFGVFGDDSEAEMLPGVLANANVDGSHLMRVPGRKTAIKTRIVAHGQHVVRIDQETADPIEPHVSESLLHSISDVLKSVDCVVLSDYAKGLLTVDLIAGIVDAAHKKDIPVIVDPKGRDFSKYRGADVITPNKKEAAEAAQIDDSSDSVERSAPILMNRFAPKALLITEGEHGMSLFEGGQRTHLDSVAQEVYDVTGAGDTVIAAFAAAVAAGASYLEAANIANYAAGIVVAHVGTTSINKDLLSHMPTFSGDVASA